MYHDFYQYPPTADSFFLPSSRGLASLGLQCPPLPQPQLYGAPSGFGGSLAGDRDAPTTIAPPGEGATDDQILEYALFVSKVEAAAKGLDKQEDKKRLKERLEAYGFEEKQTRDDGNCQFCAVSDQLYGHEGEQANIRAKVIEWLSKNSSWNPSGQEYGELYRFINDEPWADYLQRMSTDKQWGDHLTLVAMSEIFGVAICIISSVPGDKFITHIIPGARESLHAGRRATIYLAHHLELHYISIRELQDVTLSISGFNSRPGLSAFNPTATSLPFPQLPTASPATTAVSPHAAFASVYQGFMPTLKLILISARGTEARRIPLERWPSLPELVRIIGDKFGKHATYAYAIKYKDEEGDLVSIVNQTELADAISFVEKQRTILTLEIHPTSSTSSVPNIPSAQSPSPASAVRPSLDEMLDGFIRLGFTDTQQNIFALGQTNNDFQQALALLQRQRNPY